MRTCCCGRPKLGQLGLDVLRWSCRSGPKQQFLRDLFFLVFYLVNISLILPINLYIPLIVWCRGNDETDLSSFASNVLKNIFGELVKI